MLRDARFMSAYGFGSLVYVALGLWQYIIERECGRGCERLVTFQ